MSEFSQLNERIESSLKLATHPVAVLFSNQVATQGERPAQAAPAGCAYWESGAKQAVATIAEDHQHCSIGVHTHNLADAPESQQRELEVTLAAMQGLEYVKPAEVQAIPVMTVSTKTVIYSPLAEVTDAPAVVLLFCEASQGLIVAEALARVDGGAPIAMGRPSCALIPQIINSGRSATSLGCCGARAYLDVFRDDIAMWGLYGSRLADYVTEIEKLSKANAVLTQFHTTRRAAIESGESPTVEESLSTLG